MILSEVLKELGLRHTPRRHFRSVLNRVLRFYQTHSKDVKLQESPEGGVWHTPWGIQLIASRGSKKQWTWRYDANIEQFGECMSTPATCSEEEVLKFWDQIEANPDALRVKSLKVKQLEARLGIAMKLMQKAGAIGVWFLITEDLVVFTSELWLYGREPNQIRISQRAVGFPLGPKMNIYNDDRGFTGSIYSFRDFNQDCKHTKCTTCGRCSKCHPEFRFQLKRCSLCHKAAYCDIACQKMDWGRHKQGHCLALPRILDMLNVFLLTELSSIVLEYSQVRARGFQTRTLCVNTQTVTSLSLSENDGGFTVLFHDVTTRRRRHIKQYDKVSLQCIWTWEPKRRFIYAITSCAKTIFAIQGRMVNMVDAKSGKLQDRSRLPKHGDQKTWNVKTCVASTDRLYLMGYDMKLWIFKPNPVQMQFVNVISLDGVYHADNLILHQGQLLLCTVHRSSTRHKDKISIVRMDPKSLENVDIKLHEIKRNAIDVNSNYEQFSICCIGERLFIQKEGKMIVFCLNTMKLLPPISISYDALGITSTSSYELVVRTKDGFSFLS